ncbi:MAG TPA: hypothetical protein VIL86_10915 [Tepidisphaeraceae bacterium]|jgi:hypothetical protein
MVTPPTVDPQASAMNWLTLPSHWPGQSDLLTWCQTMGPGTAALLIILGVIYLMFGFYLFKFLITLNAALVGAALGAMVGDKLGSALAGAVVGGMTCAVVAWPLMKYAVAIMGGLYGALLGMALWRTFGLDGNFAWAGGAIGLVAFGMLSFILFRGSIIMYTSLQGSVMLIFGLLGMIYKYQSVSGSLTSGLSVRPFLLPIFIFIPAMIGLIYQQQNHPAEGK